ncbi:hypothetical protein [Enterococcus durans]|nr:hypothetical protein [Enterococcus durans]
MTQVHFTLNLHRILTLEKYGQKYGQKNKKALKSYDIKDSNAY